VQQQTFVSVPSIYPKLIEIRKSKTVEFKPNKFFKETTKLRYYQVVGALHMMLLDRMVLGDACGLGKTISGLAAYSYLLEKDPTVRLLVVCTKSAMYQWAEEVQKFFNGITTRVVSNEFNGMTGYTARKTQYDLFKENIMVINYAPTLEEYETISSAMGANYMVILDEVTAVKSMKTKTHFGCKFICDRARRVYGLSATIIKNGLEEVYGIYDVIVPGLFGRITRFRESFCQQRLINIVVKGKQRKIPKTVGYKNLGKFKTIINPYFLGRKKEEVADELPKLISHKIILEMLPEQKDLYKQALTGILYEEKIKHEYFEVMDMVRLGATDEKTVKKYEELKVKYDRFATTEGKKRGKLAALTYCQMVSNGPALLNQPGASSKEEELERLLTEELITEKIIVYSRFSSGIPYLEIICERHHILYTKITGDDSGFERGIAKKRFQEDPNYRVIFITAAGSESLNLQAAGVIIFYDTPWSYGDLAQTIGRAQRIGSIQSHVLLIHLVNKGSIDVRVMSRVTDKKDLSDEILGDTAKGALSFASHEDSVVDDLFSDIIHDAESL